MDVYKGGDYLNIKFPRMPYIVADGILPAESKVVLFGAPKQGKSVLLNQLALSITNGRDWLNFKTNMAKILYLNFEVGHPAWQDRWSKQCGALGVRMTNDMLLVSELKGCRLDTIQGQAELEKLIAIHRPTLTMLDPYYKILSSSNNNDDSVTAAINFLDSMIASYRTAVVICAHSRKSQVSGGNVVDLGGQELRGSGLLLAWADGVLYQSPVGKDKTRSRMEFYDCRHAEKDLQPINLLLDRNRLVIDVVP